MSAETNDCPRCGTAVRRSGANRVAVAQPSVDTRGMFRRFSEATAELDHGYAKVEADLERPVRAPDLWREAKATHRAMVAAGEASGPPTPTERATNTAGLTRSPAGE